MKKTFLVSGTAVMLMIFGFTSCSHDSGGTDLSQVELDYRTSFVKTFGQPAAERLKIQIGNAAPEKTIEKMELKGTDAITGLPRRLEIDSVEVREALKEPVTKIVEEIKSVLSETPPELASDIIERGGTILYTARSKYFATDEGHEEGAAILKKHGIDGLVVIGGDGSFKGAQGLSHLGINTIGIPGTIDLDIACTDYTIGFDTAVNTAMEAIDKIRDTSTSHERCSVIEVMGRNAGYIALWCGIANGAEDILLPEKYDGDVDKLIEHIKETKKKGKKHHIVINAEGIGHSQELAERIEKETGMETRATILGHLQRGGSPTCKDRVYASIMGAYAVDLLADGKTNRVVAYKDGKYVDLYNISKNLAR